MAFLAIFLLVGASLAGLVGLDATDLPTEGSDGADGFSGTPEDDTFAAAGGNDLLDGAGGNDQLQGQDGNDWLLGFDGDDSLSGNRGEDVLIGGAGADVIDAGDGNDFVEAANLVDEAALRASLDGLDSLTDLAFGYALADPALDGGDTVELGDGNDTVVAGNDDTLTGGDGEDEFALGDWIQDGRPVEITDFDTAEDVISFVYDRDGPTPELSFEVDERNGVTTLRADGQAVAVLRNAAPDFSLQNVAVGRYAA